MMQNAFTQAFIKLDLYRYKSNFGAWLKRIVVNTCINAINKKKVGLIYCDEIYQHKITEEQMKPEVQFSVTNITKAMEELPKGTVK